MIRKMIDREAEIDTLSEDSLRDRLKLAEELCVLFGWTSSRRHESPRDCLAFKAWQRWYEYVGDERGGRKSNRRIAADVDHAEGRS